jgi:hypothetical protein
MGRSYFRPDQKEKRNSAKKSRHMLAMPHASIPGADVDFFEARASWLQLHSVAFTMIDGYLQQFLLTPESTKII